MAKSNPKLNQAQKELKEKQDLVKRLKQEEQKKFEQFSEELKDYCESLIESCLKGETVISGLDKVFVRRGIGKDDDGWIRYAYYRAFSFKRDCCYHYENAEEEFASIAVNDPDLFGRIEADIVGDGVLIDVGEGFAYNDGSLIRLDEVAIYIFAYYYRQDQDSARAIRELKRILEKNKKLRGYKDFFVELEVIKYLYNLS